MAELTPKEQYIFELIQTKYHTLQQELEKEEDIYGSELQQKIGIQFFDVMLAIEMKDAKHALLPTSNETTFDDALVANLKRLFCSGQKSDFVLAKQLLWGLILSEKVLLELIRNVYNHYLNWENDIFLRFYFYEIRSVFQKLEALAKISEMKDLTDKDRKELPEMEIQAKRRLITTLYLSMLGEGEISSAWLR
jgi:hypothetical protein